MGSRRVAAEGILPGHVRLSVDKYGFIKVKVRENGNVTMNGDQVGPDESHFFPGMKLQLTKHVFFTLVMDETCVKQPGQPVEQLEPDTTQNVEDRHDIFDTSRFSISNAVPNQIRPVGLHYDYKEEEFFQQFF